jgi:hypothetical protein
MIFGFLMSCERKTAATDSNRAAAKRSKQPLWLCKVMGYHIQPIARKVGITKRIAWHTFRRTYSSILQDNREDVKVVQELLRHSSVKMTLDVYAQALTPSKRAAQRKVGAMIRENLSDRSGKKRLIVTPDVSPDIRRSRALPCRLVLKVRDEQCEHFIADRG